MAFGVFALILALLKKPVLCSNFFIVYMFFGLVFGNMLVNGAFKLNTSMIIMLLAILFFFAFFFTIGGLKYRLDCDLDTLEDELAELGFPPSEYVHAKRANCFTAPNGAKIYVRKIFYNDTVEISITKELQLLKVLEARNLIAPVVRKYNNITKARAFCVYIIIIGALLIVAGLFFVPDIPIRFGGQIIQWAVS